MRRAMVVAAVMAWSGGAWGQGRPDDCSSKEALAVIYRRGAKNNPGNAALQQRAADHEIVLARCHADEVARVAKEKADREAEREARRIEAEKRAADGERFAAKQRADAAENAAAAKAKEDQEVADEAALNVLRADNKRMRYVFGAAFCTYAFQRKLILEAIAKDKRMSRTAGVIDLRRRKEYKDSLEIVARDEAQMRENLAKRRGLTAANCSDATVQALLACRDEQKCREPWHTIAITMLPETPSEIE